MPLTSAPVLPPELVELIVEHLSDSHTLRFCALISRTWASPCQRALFHHLHLDGYLEVVRLPAHLIRYPHLQRFIQDVSLQQTPWDFEIRERVPFVWWRTYLSGLTALFPLISHTTSLVVTFDRHRHWNTHDQQFVEAFGAFLQSESLQVLDIRGLQDPLDLQQILSFLNGTQVQRLSLHTEGPDSMDPIGVDFFSSALTIAYLPAVKLLRIDTHDAFLLAAGLKIWLGQHPAMFPKLKDLEIVVYDGLNLGFWFSGILQPAALRLESFRLELTCTVWGDHMPTHKNLFNSLQCRHLHLHMFEPECSLRAFIDPSDAQAMIDWFAAMLRHLADDGSTIHFTELTFTFPDEPVEWEEVQDVLSHAAFAGVERIHFEAESHKGSLITNLQHPELVSAIRDAFPRLASRGVLCFEEGQVGKVERGAVPASWLGV